MPVQRPTTRGDRGQQRERRAFRREPIRLAGELQPPAGAPIPCTALDYCLGGMLIALRGTVAVPVGETVSIRCALPDAGEGEGVEFRGRVVHAGEGTLGLAFLDPDLAAIQRLQEAARTFAREGGGDGVPLSPEKRSALVRECNERVRETLAPLMDRFYQDINEVLFQAAEESREIAVQNANLQGLSELNRRKETLRSGFLQATEARLEEAAQGRLPTPGDDPRPEGGSGLSLVDPEAFEEWLAVTDLVTKVENDHRVTLNMLARRLGVVFAGTVNARNNPYGPALFAESFRDALSALDLAHSARLACYKALRTGVRATATRLYDALNECLIAAGVLPGLEDGVARAPAPEPAPAAADPVEEEPSAPAAAEGADAAAPVRTPPGGAPTAAGGGGHGGAAPTAGGPAGAGAPGPGAAAGFHGDATSGAAATGAAPGSPAPRPAPDLYQVVGDLRSLQQRVTRPAMPAGAAATSGPGGGSGGGGPAPGGAGAAADGAAGVPSGAPSGAPGAAGPASGPVRPYSTTELLEALSTSEFRRQLSAQDAASEPVDVRARLEAVLARNGAEGGTKGIPEHQGRVIDVAGNVFATLLNDLQVALSVRPWIRQLEVPVLKMALLDDRLFIDKTHIVRQVINKLSELEVLAGSENEVEQAALRRAFQWIVNTVNSEFDGTAAVFHRVAQQLDLLLRVQNDTYRRNLSEVVAECMREEAAEPQPADADAPAGSDAPQASAAEASAALPQEAEDAQDDEWLRRVRRLKEEHWLLFDAREAEPKRLKVAWIAPRSGKYVFVNVLGRKDRIVGEKELAGLLRAGDVVVLDAAEEPAMDRAQYTMLQKLHRQLLYQSSHDGLTGLINRAEFKKTLGEAVAEARVTGGRHALVLMDIDQFKVVNNTLGYEAGDAVLKALAEWLRAHLGEGHVLARVGTDQFGILLCDHSLDDALGVIEDQLDELHDYRIPWQEERLAVSVSVGLVSVHPQGEDESALLQAAETSCGVAKEMGGGRIQIYHSRHAGMSRRKEEMKWAVQIDRALDEDALSLRCQKIVPLQAHLPQQDWYELLLGLSDELQNKLALHEFIKAAEHYSRIIEVDRWVIRNAFEWIAEHEDRLLGIGGFTINLSGPSLNDERLIRYVNEEADRTGVAMQRICFEITETAGIASLSDASDFIHVIKATGCKFSLDDFGSGMSSYAYLKNLPVDFLKIDGAFVQELVADSSDYAVVKSVCEVGHFMGKAVIAEFAQSEETIELLRELGVDYVQGYAVERPHRLEALLGD